MLRWGVKAPTAWSACPGPMTPLPKGRRDQHRTSSCLLCAQMLLFKQTAQGVTCSTACWQVATPSLNVLILKTGQ